MPPDYSSLGITDVYNDATPQWFFNVSGYFGINTRRHQHVPAQRVPGRRHHPLDAQRTHELAIGVDYSYGEGDIVNNFRANGRYTFSGAAPFTGDALADFMLGKFSSFEQGIGEYKNTRMQLFALSSRTRSA